MRLSITLSLSAAALVALLTSAPSSAAAASTSAARCGADKSGIFNADKTACCPASCGKCGGDQCRKRLKDPKASAAQCCVSNIKAANNACGKPPCVVGARPPSKPVQNVDTCDVPCGRSFGPENLEDSFCCARDEYCVLGALPGLETQCKKRSSMDVKCSASEERCGGTFADDVMLTPYTTCCDSRAGEGCFARRDADPYAVPPRPTECQKPKTCPEGRQACGFQFPYMGVPLADNVCCSAEQICNTSIIASAGSFTECVNRKKVLCKPGLCKNGGRCISAQYMDTQARSGYWVRCDCPKGYTGETCERKSA